MSSFINMKCPFHVVVLSSAVFAGTSYLMYILLHKFTPIRRFNCDKRFANSIYYTTAGLVFISGQVSEIESNSIEEQTKSALECVDQALREAGSDKSKVLEVTVWLADIGKDYDGMNKVYDSWLPPGNPPCRACVEAKLASPSYRVEIRVIAAK
eukprot:gene15943-21633_t